MFTLLPSLTLSEEYTDNFRLTKTDREANFRSSVNPALQLLINGAFTKGVVAYTLSAVHDSTDPDLKYFHSLLGQVIWEVTPRLRFTVADVLTRSDEPTQADRLGLRRERQTFTSNTLSLNSDWVIGTVATTEYYRWTTFSSAGGGGDTTTSHTLGASASLPLYSDNSLTLGYQYLNSQRSESSQITGHQLTAAVARKLTALASAGISGSYAFRNANREATFDREAANTNFQVWNVALFNSYIAPPWTLSGSLGLSGVTRDSGDSLGPLLFSSTSLSYAFARAVASLSVDRGFSETFAEGEDFGVVETMGVTASLSYPFSPGMSGIVSGFYRTSEETGVGGGRQIGDANELMGLSVSLSMALLRWLNLNLSYSYLQRFDSTTPGYTENRARVAVEISF